MINSNLMDEGDKLTHVLQSCSLPNDWCRIGDCLDQWQFANGWAAGAREGRTRQEGQQE